MAQTIETAVNDLIDQWGDTLTDDDFIAALETMVELAQTALDARKEELGRE